MAYGVKYIMQFTSDRGNEIRIEVLKKDYQGEVMYKSLGGSPSLSIEQGDAAVKGSSLVFAMQADIEGELQELYTTDNKLFKVNMYRNEVLLWQGYVLPELYSEEYVDAPYDVSVTATDQLATLKAITYQREDVNVSISTMIEDILSFTQVSLPVTYHQNLSAIRKGEVPMLVDSHISQAAYNGYSCYDVLTNILLSCNCCIMQINGEWLITSLTNSTTNYYTAGVNVVREHKILGQLGVGEVCPAGTLTMVNNPALKGAKVEYAHMLRNSFLVNADCVDREGWNYTPDSRNPIDIPGEREAFGKIFKSYCWELHPVNIREDNSLQLWQEVALEKDERNYYDLSVKTLFGTNAKLLLMAVTYLGSDGIERRLTAEGWVEKWDKSDVNYYIQITGKEKNAGLDAIADIEQYEVSTVQFALPPVDGTMRIGFINSTTDYTDPLASAPIYVSQVYLTVSGVTGQECTTEVEPNATQEQQGVLLAYGDTFESENAYKLGLNTLKKSSGENITSWWLDNVNFSSYYETMLQEFSRYFGVKKAQLQGIIMGKDVLSNIYTDVFSGRVMRLLTAQVDLLADEASVTVEEIVTTTVEFDTVIYATNNTNSFGSSSGGGGGTSGGSSSTAGESLLGVQSDGDVYVKDGRALVGQEGRFENLALPVDAPTERKETRTYLYSSDPSNGAIDIAKIAKWIDEQEEMWVLDAENGVIKTTYNVVSEGEMMALRRASGSGSGGTTQITAQMITDALGYVPYSSQNPAGYITSADIPTALKNPYALTINGTPYDGSEAVDITISEGGGVADSVDWANVENKPTTLGGYGITDATHYFEGNGYAGSKLARGNIVQYGDGAEWRLTNNLWSIEYVILHHLNYASYALPLSGGELQGTTDTPLYLNGTDGSYIGFRNSAKSILGYFGFDSGQTPKVHIGYNYQYTLIHSGNIGSQSVASADIISNGTYHYPDAILTNDVTAGALFGEAAHENKVFPAFFKNHPLFEQWADVLNYTGYCKYGATQIASEYNAINPRVAIRKYNQTRNDWGDWTEFITTANIGSQSVNYANSAGKADYLPIIGGLNYTTSSANKTFMISDWKSPYFYGQMWESPDGNYKMQLVRQLWTEGLKWRIMDSGIWNEWKTIIDSSNIGSYNAGSATKLQTARSIWGQSFDGTRDVDGAFKYGYINLEAGNEINSKDTNGTGIALCLNWQGSGNVIMTLGGGNALIGTATDNGAKLQVNGGVTTYGSINMQSVGEIQNALGISCYDNGTGYYVGSRNAGLGLADGGCLVYTYGSTPISFYTYGSERMRIAGSGGNVLIGTTNDNGNKLQVNGSITATEWLYGGDNCGMYITNTGVYYSNHATYANIESAGNEICIGGNTGGSIYVNYRVPRHYNIAPTSWIWCAGSSGSRADHYIGNLIATGEVISLRRATSSDARLKDNINRLIAEDCLAIVRNLQPSSWQWKEDGKFSLGFIAQDIEPLMPYAVTRIKDDVLGQRLNLQYDQFFAPVVGAIQCLDVKVENHETRLKRLETENAELKNRLSKYETVWQ